MNGWEWIVSLIPAALFVIWMCSREDPDQTIGLHDYPPFDRHVRAWRAWAKRHQVDAHVHEWNFHRLITENSHYGFLYRISKLEIAGRRRKAKDQARRERLLEASHLGLLDTMTDQYEPMPGPPWTKEDRAAFDRQMDAIRESCEIEYELDYR